MVSLPLIPTLLLLIFIWIVETYRYGDTDMDQICQMDHSKGIYIQNPGLNEKCCKGTFLDDPYPLEYTRVFEQIGCPDLGVNATESADLHGALPPWAYCRCNVSRDNPEDEMPTLMWKVEACIIKTYLGTTEDLIDFQAFVNFRVTNYTDKNNVAAVVKKANAECPEATKDLEFHKKIETYTWCFYRNEEKVCNEPTESVKQRLDQIDSWRDERANLFKPSCKLNLTTKGMVTQHCCRGKTTPTSYTAWHESSRVSFNMINGTFVGEDRSTKCMNSVVAQANPNKSDDFYYPMCIPACIHSPAVFKNETEGPQINWNFQGAFDTYFTSFTEGILKNLTELSGQIKPQYSIMIRGQAINNRTEVTFDQLETAYKDSKDPVQKAMLYCHYFEVIRRYTTLVLAKYCYPDVATKVFLENM